MLIEVNLLVPDDTAGKISSPDLFKLQAHLSNCLPDIPTWISHRHLQLSVAKMQLLILPHPRLLLLQGSLSEKTALLSSSSSCAGQNLCSHPWLFSLVAHFTACQCNLQNIFKIQPLLTTFILVQASHFSLEVVHSFLKWSPCSSTFTLT